MSTAVNIFTSIRETVSAVTGIKRVNSNRRNDKPASGKFEASVLYNGDDMDLFSASDCPEFVTHNLPVTVQLRSTTNSDDVLVDKIYLVLDALLDPDNLPPGSIMVTPLSIEAPEGSEYLSCDINVVVQFRGA